ncbi:RecB family exonuclease [Kutzneria chonburiensis]|uniref:RecB family exonuclease n=1 Tax=Kutzneria chonburiensis TaxID=1483604 RepID=A0ABV6N3A0_9PSEU|nr:PD-(D/E)XK nuclease family protein [Kutzneria chonburiensis]
MTYRSVSQLKSYARCAYGYYLERVAKAWTRPAAWLPQGVAVHEAVEAVERSGRTMTAAQAQGVFRESYAREVNASAATCPNFNWWMPSGRHQGEADIARRWGLGLDQVAAYVDYVETHPHEVIWVAPDGTPAIELEFEVRFGTVIVRGYLDQAVEVDGEVRVRDVKTGLPPDDELQLGVYGVALSKTYDVEVRTGDYWMAKAGRPAHPYDLTAWTEERITEAFEEMDAGVRSGRFEPDPEPAKCDRCPVKDKCEFGPMADFLRPGT